MTASDKQPTTTGPGDCYLLVRCEPGWLVQKGPGMAHGFNGSSFGFSSQAAFTSLPEALRWVASQEKCSAPGLPGDVVYQDAGAPFRSGDAR